MLRPGLDELDAGCRLALDNAKGLVSEAGLLLGNGAWPRAYVLAQLASEELAKADMLWWTGFRLGMGAQVDWDEFWRDFRSHKAKITKIEALRAVLRHAPADVESWERTLRDIEESAALNPRKNDGLYVGYDGQRFCSPSEAMKREEAAGRIEAVKAMADAVGWMVRDRPGELIANLRRVCGKDSDE